MLGKLIVSILLDIFSFVSRSVVSAFLANSFSTVSLSALLFTSASISVISARWLIISLTTFASLSILDTSFISLTSVPYSFEVSISSSSLTVLRETSTIKFCEVMYLSSSTTVISQFRKPAVSSIVLVNSTIIMFCSKSISQSLIAFTSPLFEALRMAL